MVKLDWTLVPWKGVEAVANAMNANAGKYPLDHWKGVRREEHLKAMMRHMAAVMQGDTSEDHLAHATTRGLMAMACDEVGVECSGASREDHAHKSADPPWFFDSISRCYRHRKGQVSPDGDGWVASVEQGRHKQRFSDERLEDAMAWVERGGK